ncbi:MAG: hypothetical protein AB7G12_11290 [Thermoanaerobaculia bacterium]
MRRSMFRSTLLLATAVALVAAGVARADDPSARFFALEGPVGQAPEGNGVPNCDGFDLYQEPLDVQGFGGASTSDVEAAFEVAEDTVVGAVITPLAAGMGGTIRLWNLSLEFDPSVGFIDTCTADETALTPFNIIFSADNAGQPGAVLATVEGTPTSILDTQIPFAFTTIRETEISFPAVDVAGAAWITVQRQTGVNAPGGNPCYFLWVDEQILNTYDDQAYQSGTPTGDDAPICLGSAPAGPTESVLAIPTLGQAGIAVLLLSLAIAGILFLRRN